jgi:hypothetical protein
VRRHIILTINPDSGPDRYLHARTLICRVQLTLWMDIPRSDGRKHLGLQLVLEKEESWETFVAREEG